MAKLVYILDRQLNISRHLLSFRNDGASIQPGKQLPGLREALCITYGGLTKLQHLDPLRRLVAPSLERQSSSQRPVFRLKECKSVLGVEQPLEPDLPGGELNIHEGITPELPVHEWNIHHEPLDGPDDFYERSIAPHSLAGKGALITGSAGTGKSHVLGRIEEDLKAQGLEVRKISLTHVACRRLGDAGLCSPSSIATCSMVASLGGF